MLHNLDIQIRFFASHVYRNEVHFHKELQDHILNRLELIESPFEKYGFLEQKFSQTEPTQHLAKSFMSVTVQYNIFILMFLGLKFSQTNIWVTFNSNLCFNLVVLTNSVAANGNFADSWNHHIVVLLIFLVHGYIWNLLSFSFGLFSKSAIFHKSQ